MGKSIFVGGQNFQNLDKYLPLNFRSATAGGCRDHRNTFSNNPQFLINLQGSKNDYTCVIGLTQKTAKHAGSGKVGSLQIGK